MSTFDALFVPAGAVVDRALLRYRDEIGTAA